MLKKIMREYIKEEIKEYSLLNMRKIRQISIILILKSNNKVEI